MATEAQHQRFRDAVADPGGESPVFSDEQIDGYFEEAVELYPSANNTAQLAYAVIEGIKVLRANAAKQVSYGEGASNESLSDIFRALTKLQEDWQAKFDKALSATKTLVQWGSAKPKRTERDRPIS